MATYPNRQLEYMCNEDSKTDLLHLQNQLVNRPCLWSEFSTITNRHGASDIRSVAIPFTASVDEKDLRVHLSSTTMSEFVSVLMIVWMNGSPCKFAVVATVMKRGFTRSCCYDGQVGLVDRAI